MKTVKTKTAVSESDSIKGAVAILWAAKADSAARSRQDIIDVARKQFGLSWRVINERLLSDKFRFVPSDVGGNRLRKAYFFSPESEPGAYTMPWKATQQAEAKVTSKSAVVNTPEQFKLAVPAHPVPAPSSKKTAAVVGEQPTLSNADCYIPPIDPNYVKWGDYDKVLKIISSKSFFPLYISGMSGTGKTVMVEQACANLQREYVRVQVSPETDEDDLLGGFRLLNGETVFAKGPVVRAMEEGCILLIDEIDRGSMKIMCLQGVLEGKPIRIKKTGEVITPKPGFNIIATANTKGKGSMDGKYAAASIIDDALLERFAVSVEQTHASDTIEKKIILKYMTKLNCLDDDFAVKLVAWSAVIRRTFANEAIDDVISTRRLCHIVQSFAMFGDRLIAIDLAISKFDANTKNAFLDLYSKIDETINRSDVAMAMLAESNNPNKTIAALKDDPSPF